MSTIFGVIFLSSGSYTVHIAILGFYYTPCTKGLFSQEDGKEIHNEACFKQTCDQSLSSCGRTKFAEVFASLVSKLGEHRTEVFQHQKQSYVKPDGSQV